MVTKNDKTVLVTGSAGFIGFHLSKRLLQEGYAVLGIDNLNEYYNVQLKLDRLGQLQRHNEFMFLKIDLEDEKKMMELFQRYTFDAVVNLAAQAGVRYSLENPKSYIDSNTVGFLHVLEGCRTQSVEHLVFASSSSVYGANTLMPFSVSHNVDHPVSLYAATKKSNELMAHAYAHLYGIPCTGLRFFTVYGPWGRPDMALFIFTKAILEKKPIKVFNHGKMKRDFTYIDDIVEGVINVMKRPPKTNTNWTGDAPDPGSSPAPYRIYNIGNNQMVELEEFISVLEKCLGARALKEYLPLQDGDVPASYADIEDMTREFGFIPKTTIYEGIPRFVEWYERYMAIREPKKLKTPLKRALSHSYRQPLFGSAVMATQ